ALINNFEPKVLIKGLSEKNNINIIRTRKYSSERGSLLFKVLIVNNRTYLIKDSLL
ncbi:hypothetical protein B0T13DRAFT_407190, partial [Neurospora crassa]